MSVQEPAELKRAVTVSVHTVDGTASEPAWRAACYTLHTISSAFACNKMMYYMRTMIGDRFQLHQCMYIYI